jgi:cytochrome P450
MLENMRYFEELVEESRRHPTDNLLRALIDVEQDGDRLNLDELVATLVLLVAAGHETVVMLIGNAVLALLQHPEQRRRFLAEPGLARNAVEEVLRWDPPVQLTQRIALEDLGVAGHTIPRGTPIALLLAAANRDEAHVADGDRFDIGRADIHHLGFAAGPHHCLGAALARIEGEIVLRSLFSRFPALRLAEGQNVRYRDTMVMRGLEAFPVEF